MLNEQTTTTTAHVPVGGTRPRPREYAHIVLKTAQPDEMIDWYCKVVGMSVVMRSKTINFLTFDGSQDRLAIIRVPPELAPDARNSNLHHIAFGYDRIADVVSTFRSVASEQIQPHWCVNHGVATAMYFHDPDGNSVELTVDNFQTVEALNAWLATGAFDANPIGVTLQPEELARRVESGEPEASVLRPHPDHATSFQAELAGRRKKP